MGIEDSAYRFGNLIWTMFMMEILIACFVILIMGRWKLFEKAGLKGWYSLIPIYNTYCMFKITFGQGWLILFLIIPFMGMIIYMVSNVYLGKRFGKGKLFCLGLSVLPHLFFAILGFEETRYQGLDT